MIRYISKKSSSQGFRRSTVSECIRYLKSISLVSVDIETSKKFNKYPELEGLDPYTSNIVMLQVGDQNVQYIIDAREIDIKPIVRSIANKTVVGANLKFEYKHLYHKTGVKLELLYDVMLADQLIHMGYGYRSNLEAMVLRYLDIDLPPTIAKSFLNIGTREFTRTQIQYGANDIKYPMLIKEYQDILIEQKDLSRVVELENLFVPVLGDIELNGMNLNTEMWSKLAKENRKIYEELEMELNEFVLKNSFDSDFVSKQYDLFNTEESFKSIVEWNSPTKVSTYFAYLGICPKDSQTNKYSVNGDLLRSHIPHIADKVDSKYIDLIQLYLKYKEYQKSCTTYGEDFFKYIHPITGRLHSNFRQLVNTGRISSGNPNLQNLPSDQSVRDCFTAPEGYKMIVADYSGKSKLSISNNVIIGNYI